jgi:MFS family permease
MLACGNIDRVLNRLGFPDLGPHRRFVAALGIDAIGSGLWMPLSILYFLARTDLSLVEVGLATSIASLVTIPLVPVAGEIVDLVGSKPLLQTGNLIEACGFALYPFAHSLLVAILVLTFVAIGRTAFWGSYGPLVTSITQPGERETWFGFLQAMRNVGFGIGGLLAALALTIGTAVAYEAVVLANATSYLLAFWLMIRVYPGPAVPAGPRQTGAWGVVLRDRGYRWLVVSNVGYAMVGMSLNVMMPVYFLRLLGLPGWVPGTVFVINTVMVGVGQGLVVKAMAGAVRSRVLALASMFSGSAFVALYVANLLPEQVAVVLVLATAVVYTLGEMTAGPVIGALAAEAAPAELRGRYMSVVQLSWSIAAAIAPVLYSWLLDRGALPGWGVLALIAMAWGAVTIPLHRRLPLAASRVTNQPSQV